MPTLQHLEIDPDRLSFTIALRTARDQVVQARGIMTGAVVELVELVGRIGAAVLSEPMPARRIHTRPRAIKRAISKYRAKERNIDRRAYPTTLTTKNLTPTPNRTAHPLGSYRAGTAVRLETYRQ